METAIHEDILIVGAGIGGLTTALGLHRLGIRSLLLESSDSLRITGFALTMWTNAWRALDCVGIGDSLRAKSLQIQDFQIAAGNPSQPSPVQSPEADVKFGKSEIRCVRRKDLLETLERELPQGTIRYSSKPFRGFKGSFSLDWCDTNKSTCRGCVLGLNDSYFKN
ncbi:3-hydroxybenzoate 6-monooxygenase [Handroanthus impetiginosus]|uniref:3-hydroxybenzoate 6-monooxygenase n=1 Tax=Handroanthus impetiginosus TaxID=429701 RepID=A0A2G9GFP3_9LAMI|nr:3-hydroxybenzoate 6-monooxygenase [Handroanthus impetiginosus]